MRQFVSWLQSHTEFAWGLAAALLTALLLPPAVAAVFGEFAPERPSVVVESNARATSVSSGQSLLSWSAADANGSAVDQSTGTPASPILPVAPNADAVISATTAADADSAAAPSPPTEEATSAVIEDTEAPTVPSRLSAEVGTESPTIATLSWSSARDDVGVVGYHVFVASDRKGPYDRVGDTQDTSFEFVKGVVGLEYHFRVAAFDAAGNQSPSASTDPVKATWTQQPHATYDTRSESCGICHAARTTTITSTDSKALTGEAETCFACHNGEGARSNVRSGGNDSFALKSGHSLESTKVGDLTTTCSDCHDPHRDPNANSMLPRTTINGEKVTQAGAELCLACHDEPTDWYGADYPSTAKPSRDASGYPIAGVFTSSKVYLGKTNAHRLIAESTQTAGSERQVPRTRGDCRYCHTSHRGNSTYDSLRAAYRTVTPDSLEGDIATGAYAAVCLDCHGGKQFGSLETSVTDIKQFVTGPMGGHVIRTDGGDLPIGSPLPCYECHNPHGSKRGNANLITDSLGEGLETSSSAGVREFCLTCHVTADPAGAQGWDSEKGAYRLVGGDEEVVGLSRTAGVLLLPDRAEHRTDATLSCYHCHGESYKAGGRNVHAPERGVSQGGQSCYDCHEELQRDMEDSSGAELGSDNSASYHHVLGGSAGDGDTAFGDGQYPAAGTDVYCLSCHVDHSKFNDSKGANLRSDMSSNPAGVNSEYDPITGGVCLGCHNARQPKDLHDRATSRTSTSTPPVDGSAFDQSAHQYGVNGSFAESPFRGDCVKCHNTGLTKYQTGKDRFALHSSAESRLLHALGAAPGADIVDSQATCYRCHAGEGAGMDVYGEATMTAQSRGLKGAFSSTGSHHQVGRGEGLHRSDEASDAPRHVECEDCHSTHVAQPGLHVTGSSDAGPTLLGARGVIPAWPAANFAAPTAYSAMTFRGAAGDSEAYLCLRCHSRTLAGDSWPKGSVETTSGRYTPTDVSTELNPANQSGHNMLGVATWPKTSFDSVAGLTMAAWALPDNDNWLQPAWARTSSMACSDCHTDTSEDAPRGPHGSTSKFLIDPTNGGSYQSAYLDETGMRGRPICSKCHATGNGLLDANNVHSVPEHQGADDGKCINCHTKVPHGYQRPRMLGYTTDGASYGSLKVNSITARADRTSYNWTKRDCGTTSGCHTNAEADQPIWP